MQKQNLQPDPVQRQAYWFSKNKVLYLTILKYPMQFTDYINYVA